MLNRKDDEEEETSTCPPIEIGMHQNSYNPQKNIEKRGRK